MEMVMAKTKGVRRNQRFEVKKMELERADDIEGVKVEISGDKLRVKASSASIREAIQTFIIEERFRGMVDMASFITHEIKNPIFTLKNKVFSLLSDLQLPEDKEKEVKIIKSVFDRIDSIIYNTNIYVRGWKLDAKKKINIEAVIEDVIKEIANTKEVFPYSFTIQKSYGSDKIFVEGDEFLLKRCFSNVLLNGIESLEDSERREIFVRTYDEDEYIVCEFEDTGCGIPKERINKIFIPFYTTKTHGTGLGMSVVKKVVDLHGGKVEIESQIGKGTKVKLFFPSISK